MGADAENGFVGDGIGGVRQTSPNIIHRQPRIRVEEIVEGGSLGELTQEQIVGDVRRGLYVLSTMGFGVNLVTGDYSQGASGLWIEDGQLTHAVEEITIAGNLKEMFRNVSAIGSDLEFRGAAAVPTVRIEGMTVAGS